MFLSGPTNRCLAPAGTYSSYREVSKAYFLINKELLKFKSKTHKREEIKYIYILEKLFFELLGIEPIVFGSATESIYRILSELSSIEVKRGLNQKRSKPCVAMSAYTCPDIASAAVRAGFRIYPLDLNLEDLSPKIEIEKLKENNVTVLILSNLYGMLNPVKGIVKNLRENNILLLDDAAQSFLSKEDGVRAGLRGDVGVVSFGRGKAINGISGGAILGQRNDIILDLVARLRVSQRGSDSNFGFRDLLIYLLSTIFEKPNLYSIPSQSSFLKLGETDCILDFKYSLPSKISGANVVAQLKSENKRKAVRIKNAQKLSEIFKSNQNFIIPYLQAKEGVENIPIRFPLICLDSKFRDRLYLGLKEKGLGVSCSYPRLIQDYKELENLVELADTPNASIVAKNILTLPTHEYVTEGDLEKMNSFLKVC